MKLLAILISLLMMPGKIEKTEMLPILVRAEGCAEKADALYKQMYNFIWEEYERGKSDIAEEGWDGIVRPLEGQAYSYKEKALGDILEIICELNGIEYTQNKVYVEGIPLEINYKDFRGRLMDMGFKKEVEQKAETNGKEAFFTGRIRNVP